MLQTFQLAFVQRGLTEVLLLSLASGLLGTWIVLRGLAFFSHAVGTAAFPGLVLADGLGFAATLGALGTAVVFALMVRALSGRRRSDTDSLTAVVLAGFLAVGVILASDVFQSGAGIETLLFGSLLVIGSGDLLLAGAASALVLVAGWVLGPRWLASGFDGDAARAIGLRSSLPDLVLLALIALTTIAALSAVGALLASALIVVPAATVRLWTRRLATWQIAAVLLAAAEGVGGIWLSVETNAPPGATIAVISGGVFALALGVRRLPRPRGQRRAGLAVGIVVLVVVVAGCGAGVSESAGPPPLAVVASTTQLGDFVAAVGGERMSLHQILQPNSDPHDYEPRPDDVIATAGAAVVFTSGLDLDPWMAEVVSEAGGSPRVIDVGASVPVARAGGDGRSTLDPHWWHDPRNVEAAVVTIGDALSSADPAGADAYAANATAYLSRVRALDRGIRACLGAVPPTRRTLVTDHDSFSYFAERYDISVVGAVIPSQTTQAQPSAADVARLSRLIDAEGVTAIFPEASANSKLVEAIARETGATAEYRLYGDTLGPSNSPGATYLGMERANADAMVRGFTRGATGCTIPGIP